MKIYSQRFLFIMILGCFVFHAPFIYGQKIKSVKKLPVLYAYPVDSNVTVIAAPVEKPWIVYSDRSNNVSYTDSKIRTTLKNIGFLESFYVTDETSDLVEIIKYAPDMLEANMKLKAPSKVQYYGWIQKSKLLLAQNSFVEISDKRPLKWVTMIHGKKFVEKVRSYTEADRLKLFDAPDLQTSRTASLYFNEIVYVYKTYGDNVLIGKQTHFTPDNCGDVLLGWVPSSFVQSWGQRMCLEPLSGQSSTPLIYPTKEWALSGSNTTAGFPIEPPPCEKVYNWKKYPVFKVEKISKSKGSSKLFYTGAVTSTFDKSNSSIFNVNGAKLMHSKLCEIAKSNTTVNIIVALNLGTDIREYLYDLTKSLQQFAGSFETDKSNLQYHFAAIDCANSSSKTEFKNHYEDILPELIDMTQKNMDPKAVPAVNGIANGLIAANNLLKGHDEEINIVIIISSKPDADTRLLKEPLYTELGNKNVRLMFVQPYAGDAEAYADFSYRGNSIIDAIASKALLSKRNKLPSNIYSSERRFRTMSSVVSGNKVQFLDFPTLAGTQGFMIIPTVNSKLEGKTLNMSMDTLMSQIQKDNELTLLALQRAFNSSNSFNTTVNKTFINYYKNEDALPADLMLALNSVDYNYFIPGYTACPESIKPFKLNLLLSTEEYEDIYNMFKGLKLDQLTEPYELKARSNVYKEFSRLLTDYNTEHYTSIPIYSLTFSDYFYRLFGFYSDDELMNKYKVYDLNSPNIINKDDLKKMIDHLNSRINAFYKLRGDTRTMFVSNGNNYYWISEDYLP